MVLMASACHFSSRSAGFAHVMFSRDLWLFGALHAALVQVVLLASFHNAIEHQGMLDKALVFRGDKFEPALIGLSLMFGFPLVLACPSQEWPIGYPVEALYPVAFSVLIPCWLSKKSYAIESEANRAKASREDAHTR
jgi:hypothetical protein